MTKFDELIPRPKTMFAKIKCRCLITQGNRDNIPIHNWIFGLILYLYSSSNEKIVVAGSCFYICVCRIAWHTMYYSRISTLYIYGIDHLMNPGICHPRWRFSTPNVTSLFLEMTNKTQMYFGISCRKFDRARLKTLCWVFLCKGTAIDSPTAVHGNTCADYYDG